MSEASFASLNPAILARKGGAKPAMRPQLGPIPDAAGAANLEDLGWNDMGDNASGDAAVDVAEPATQQSADIVQLAPMIASEAKPIQQDNEPLIISHATKTKTTRRSALGRGKRAAFTLRLDADRHLKLRLASTMKGESAQQLVTQALDTLLGQIEDLDALAAKMSRQ